MREKSHCFLQRFSTSYHILKVASYKCKSHRPSFVNTTKVWYCRSFSRIFLPSTKEVQQIISVTCQKIPRPIIWAVTCIFLPLSVVFLWEKFHAVVSSNVLHVKTRRVQRLPTLVLMLRFSILATFHCWVSVTISKDVFCLKSFTSHERSPID